MPNNNSVGVIMMNNDPETKKILDIVNQYFPVDNNQIFNAKSSSEAVDMIASFFGC